MLNGTVPGSRSSTSRAALTTSGAAPAASGTARLGAFPSASQTGFETAASGAAPATSGVAGPTSRVQDQTSGVARDRSAGIGRLLTVLALVGGVILAGIGFTGSYTALRNLGFTHGLGDFAHAFPIGVDAGIVVLLALDLHLIRKGTPWPVLRLLAHTFTGATIVFNAAAAKGPVLADPIGAAMHAVIPVMFVAAVEAGRRLVIQAARIEAGQESAGVPLHRWMLAPAASWRMYRRMRLWNLASYAQAVAMERELTVYRVMLEREHGSVRRAPSDAKLPLTMAPYGLSVDEALMLPQEAAEAAQLRKERAAERAQEAELRAAQRAAEAEIARAANRGRIAAAKAASEAGVSVAEAQARAARMEAEAAAAEVEARAREVRARAAEVARREAEEQRRKEAAEREAAEARRRAAEAAAAAAEVERAAVEARRRAAEVERAAVEAEDEAGLNPKERAVRKVARLILAEADGNPKGLPLNRIEQAFGVGESTASSYRTQAAALLDSGYRP